MTRVIITVHSDGLGKVEVDHSERIRSISDNPKDIVRDVLNAAVDQVRAAYGIVPELPSSIQVIARNVTAEDAQAFRDGLAKERHRDDITGVTS